MTTTCAVIPAAGRGSRLGADAPKVLVPITESETILSILAAHLLPLVDHLVVIASPAGSTPIAAELARVAPAGATSIEIQPTPRGMGDAVFCGEAVWQRFDRILVVWGDQVFVSRRTLEESLSAHGGLPRSVAIPVTIVERPYVEYRFDERGHLIDILQEREGDRCAPGGLGDTGTFVLSTAGIRECWDDYVASTPAGAATGELNFLPFLCYLSRAGWRVCPVRVEDSREARGINTPDDLAYFRSIFRQGEAR